MYVERTKTAPLKSEDYNEQSKSLHCHTHLRAINYDNHFPAGECVCVWGGARKAMERVQQTHSSTVLTLAACATGRIFVSGLLPNDEEHVIIRITGVLRL